MWLKVGVAGGLPRGHSVLVHGLHINPWIWGSLSARLSTTTWCSGRPHGGHTLLCGGRVLLTRGLDCFQTSVTGMLPRGAGAWGAAREGGGGGVASKGAPP